MRLKSSRSYIIGSCQLHHLAKIYFTFRRPTRFSRIYIYIYIRIILFILHTYPYRLLPSHSSWLQYPFSNPLLKIEVDQAATVLYKHHINSSISVVQTAYYPNWVIVFFSFVYSWILNIIIYKLNSILNFNYDQDLSWFVWLSTIAIIFIGCTLLRSLQLSMRKISKKFAVSK
jgi:hypothetical protein